MNGINSSTTKRCLYHILNGWKHPRYFGRLLFCVADAVCGMIILHLRRKDRKETPGSAENDEKRSDSSGGLISLELQDSLWWLFNPLPINICARGSAQSFVVLISVLATVVVATSCSKDATKNVMLRAAVAGILYRLAIHAKLYPVIYTVSYMARFSFREQQSIEEESGNSPFRKMFPSNLNQEDILDSVTTTNGSMSRITSNSKLEQSLYLFPWFNPKILAQLIHLWIKRLLFTPASIIFASCFLVTFDILTYLAYHLYGEEDLREGLIYHFS